MKKTLLLLLFLISAIGCEDVEKLTFESYRLTNAICEGCPKIDIKIPMALDETILAENINTALEEEIIALLSFDEEEEIANMGGAIKSFTKSFKELKDRFPDETVGWEATVDSDVIFEDDNIITFEFNAYSFTGGAHGYGSKAFLNFDKRSGEELEEWQLFEDLEGFQKFAETKFRIQEDIPQDANINATGFMFNGDNFHLSENVGYTEDGVQLIYNQYEVASYADGPITLTVPFAEANKYLKRKVAP